MTCTFPNCDCVRDNPPLCKKSSIHAIYPTKAGFGETQRLYTKAELQAAIAAAMMGAAEHLYQLMMDNSDEALQAQIDCLLADMTLDGNPNLAAYYRDKLIASIPSNATTALEAALMGAYKEGWSDGAANYHHDRNETPDDGWLISDTYKSIPTDASASRTHFEQERADHG